MQFSHVVMPIVNIPLVEAVLKPEPTTSTIDIASTLAASSSANPFVEVVVVPPEELPTPPTPTDEQVV